MKEYLQNIESNLSGKLTVKKRVQIASMLESIHKGLTAQGNALSYEMIKELISADNIFCKTTYYRYRKIGQISKVLFENCFMTSISKVEEIADIVDNDIELLETTISVCLSKSSIVTDKSILAELEQNRPTTPQNLIAKFQSDLNEYQNGLGELIEYHAQSPKKFIVNLDSTAAGNIWSKYENLQNDNQKMNHIYTCFFSLIHHSSVLTNREFMSKALLYSDFYSASPNDTFIRNLESVWKKFFELFYNVTKNDDLNKVAQISTDQILDKFMSAIDERNQINPIKINMARLKQC